jgi:hypothetical protein
MTNVNFLLADKLGKSFDENVLVEHLALPSSAV